MGRNAKIHILNMGLIENTPMGRLIITDLLAFAEFEPAMIIERIRSGNAIARQRGNYKDGRSPKYNKVQLCHAMGLLKNYSYRHVAEMTGISKLTLIREKRKQINI